MKELFYFIRDKDHRPVISVCLLISSRKVNARGVAICSDRDTPCSKLHAHQSNGPGIARRRAWKAYEHSKNIYPVTRAEAVDVLLRVKEDNIENWSDIHVPGLFSNKGFYLPELSPKEQRILAAVNNTPEVPR